MVPDRRKIHEIVRALLHAKKGKGGFDGLENVAQTSIASGDGSYSEPVFRGTRFSSASPQGGNAGYRTEHKPTGEYPVGKAFDLNVYPATDAERARAVELATPKGLGGAGK